MTKELKVEKTFQMGQLVVVQWATHSDEYEYERGIVVGAFLDTDNVLRYMIRINGKTKEVPYYQVFER